MPAYPHLPTDDAEFFAAYLRSPRRERRLLSRDVARANAIPPKPPQYGTVAEKVNARHPLPIRLSRRNREARLAGVRQEMVSGERVPVSGRARRDVKRERRADFWLRRKIAADDRADAQVLADLNARMLDLSWPLPQ